MPDDWFRNADWNDSIAARFEAKLRRARKKQQYLRIQALALATTHPNVALALLERYFALPNQFDHALAHCTRATALRAVGRLDEAVQAYEAALQREREFPNALTYAYLELPLLVASESLDHLFDRALRLLEDNKGRVLFPLDHFMWHAAYALISAAKGEVMQATLHAAAALQASSIRDSGLQYHSAVGLVGGRHKKIVERLRGLTCG